MKNHFTRRRFIEKSLIGSAGLATMSFYSPLEENRKYSLKLGLVTYQWGRDWDLPTLIKNCEIAGYGAVELRTTHSHGVETTLNAAQRAEVKKRFANSPVTCVGYGSNFEYHNPDQSVLREHIEQTKEYVKLCKDIGATGIKVKPNALPPEVPEEKTIAQIAAALNEVGRFAGDYGQLIRLEPHGKGTSELPVIRAIYDQVTEPNVKICWNCNTVDMNPPGIEGNFRLVSKWIGDTVHVREMNTGDYPYQQLFNLLAGNSFKGWILLEGRVIPGDRIAAMKEQLSVFNELVANVKKLK